MAVRPSPRLAVLLLLFHATVAGVVYVTAMPLAARGAMLMLILLNLSYYLARDALLLLPGSWREISLGQDSVLVVTRSGEDFYGKVANSTAVTPYFTVLCIRPEEHRLPVSRTIFPDALGTGEFRELCVHLRFAQKLPQ